MAGKPCQIDICISRIGRLLLLAGIVVVLAGPAGAQDGPSLVVGDIVLETNDVYRAEEVQQARGVMRFLRRTMNAVHIDTRAPVIRRELLFATGEEFRPDLLAETERNLRNLGFLSEVRVTAVDTTADGRVKVLVSTREAWTLRISFSYTRASDGEQRWSARIAEGNFLGYGATLGAGVGGDENASYWNAWYSQRRLFSSDFLLSLNYAERGDGHVRELQLNRPFYALQDRWGMEFRVRNNEYDRRFYLSNAGPAGIDPTETDRLYAPLRVRIKSLEARFQLRAGSADAGYVWRAGAGVDVTKRFIKENLSAVELSDDRVVDLTWIEAEGQPVARDTGTDVYPYLWLRGKSNTWRKDSFVLHYGPVEDIPLQWELDLRTGPVGAAVGSTTGYGDQRWRTTALVTRWLRALDGWVYLQGNALGDLGSRRTRTYKYDVVAGWMGARGSGRGPWLTRLFVEYAQGEALLGTDALVLGLDRGLRTLDFDGMAGDRLMRWNFEQGKALPSELFGLIRAGFGVFYGGGAAWWKDEQRNGAGLRHELGFGLRLGPTRASNAPMARIDLVWDLGGNGSPVVTAVSGGYF